MKNTEMHGARGILTRGTLFAAAVLWALSPGVAQATHTKFTQPLERTPVLTGGESVANGVVTPGANPANKITIVASDKDIPVAGLANAATNPTRMWTLGGFAIPPTIRWTSGQTITVEFINNLNDINGTSPSGTDALGRYQGLANATQSGLPGSRTELSIHHHGSHVAPSSDGWACGFYVPVGGSKNYVYPNREFDARNTTGVERGTTQWYHNHRVDVTGHTAWKGLSGGHFILDDPNDPQLPKGPAVIEGGVNKGFLYDVPIVIRDLNFASANIGGTVKQNQIPYAFDFDGSVGNHIVVNGVPQPFMNVEPTKYLFRFLVPGNARKYFMRLRQSGSSSNITMVQVMQEGGITGPVNRTEIPIGIAERMGVVIDFAPFAGKTLILQNNDTASGQCVPHSCSTATREIMQFRVGTTVTQQENLNTANMTRATPSAADLGTPLNRRSISFTREGSHWTLRVGVNGRLGDDRIMDCARTDADPIVNTTEDWTIQGVGNWTHSIHIHDVDQICVSRNGAACPAQDRFKEVWPVPPNTTWVVRFRPTDFTQIAFDPDATACNSRGAEQPPNPDNTGECQNVQFADNSGDLTTPTFTPNRHGTANVTGNQAAAEAGGGRYMIHCHVIEHEDLAMMTQWRVRSNPDGVRNDIPQ